MKAPCAAPCTHSCARRESHSDPCCTRQSSACAGEFSCLSMRRGYKGRIKNVTDREVRIELEAQARTVTVRRDQIPPEDGGAPMPRQVPSFAPSGGATPGHAGMRTPAYPTATPKHWVGLLFWSLPGTEAGPLADDSFKSVLLQRPPPSKLGASCRALLDSSLAGGPFMPMLACKYLPAPLPCPIIGGYLL